ncbi:Probable phosphomannomutase [Gryllus bimaculatus]|nr:Probable phosphomannomutase [Gryllus bimaculatus]
MQIARLSRVTWINATQRLVSASCISFHALRAVRLKSDFPTRISNCASAMDSRNKVICLFDVDGTLTRPVQVIDTEIKNFLLSTLKPKTTIGLVGGSDMKKITHQMGGGDVWKQYDYVFAENGLVAFKNGEQIGEQSIQAFIGEEKLQTFINYCLGYLSKLTLPVKRGTFVEFRKGMLNICPVGRSCSQDERVTFTEYDREHKIRETFVADMKKNFSHYGLSFALGGQISIDVFPNGWDKTYCLQYLEKDNFQEIHFFGDKTDAGGNDHEIFNDPRTIGHKVTSPHDTKSQVVKLFNL